MNEKIEELGVTSGGDIGSRRPENTERTEIKKAQKTQKQNRSKKNKIIQINHSVLCQTTREMAKVLVKAAALLLLMHDAPSQNHVHLLPRLAKHAGRITRSPGESKRRGEEEWKGGSGQKEE